MPRKVSWVHRNPTFRSTSSAPRLIFASVWVELLSPAWSVCSLLSATGEGTSKWVMIFLLPCSEFRVVLSTDFIFCHRNSRKRVCDNDSLVQCYVDDWHVPRIKNLSMVMGRTPNIYNTHVCSNISEPIIPLKGEHEGLAQGFGGCCRSLSVENDTHKTWWKWQEPRSQHSRKRTLQLLENSFEKVSNVDCEGVSTLFRVIWKEGNSCKSVCQS